MRKFEKFKVKIGDNLYDCNPEEELALAEQRINEDLKEQPSWFAWYATLYERAEAQYAEVKFLLEITEAQVDAKIRASATEKLTEKKIASLIVLNEDYQQARMELIGAKQTLGTVRAVKEGFQHRIQVLIALASNMRVQADPSIYVKKQELSEEQPKGSRLPG